MSCSIFCCHWGSIVTSGGTRAGMATNSRLGSPISFLKRVFLWKNEFFVRSSPGEPQERLLEVVVGLGGDVVVLEVLLAMEYDRLGLHFAILEMQMRGKGEVSVQRSLGVIPSNKDDGTNNHEFEGFIATDRFSLPWCRLCCRKERLGCSHRREPDHDAS